MFFKICALFSAVLAIIKITGTFALNWLVVFAPMIIGSLVIVLAVGATLATLSTLFVLIERPDLLKRLFGMAKDISTKKPQ